MRILLAAFLLAAAVLAGCSNDPEPSDEPLPTPPSDAVSSERLPAPTEDFSGVVVGDHGFPGGHAIRALHGGSHHLELVGYDPLTDKMPPGSVGTGWAAAGLWKEYACVGQFAGTGSIAIVDISDASNPVVVSQVADAQVNGDCQFTADGRFLFAGAYIGTGVTTPGVGDVPFPGTGSYQSDGVNVWDVSDKANPIHVLHSETGTYHTLMLHTTPDNVTYLIQAYEGNIYRFSPDAASLELVTSVTPMDHDMWVAKHPITNQTLLYSGDGNGFVIYGFEDPTNPVELGHWQAEGLPEGSAGWHRQASVDQLIDGKAVVVVAGETCGSGDSLPYVVVDVTDPTNATSLGTWQIPGNPSSTDLAHLCEMSPHEFSVCDGYVVSGNYHAGVWLFDIGSAERLLEPVTIGYYIPATEPATVDPAGAQDLTSPWNPFVWGAFFDDRCYVLAGDFSSGLYILKAPGITKE